jgi:16S rRNA (adenine1518-N6/adenine1519-N6)-dimethyltransferase
MAQPRKQFGQHWLRSEAALRKIIQAAGLTPQDRVLEIGPGQGALTRHLLPEAGAVLAVEIDRDLSQGLVHKFGAVDNFLLLSGDILTLNLTEALAAFPRFQAPNKVVANIPYNITGPILETLLGTIDQPRLPPFEQIVLLIQKEVAERLGAQPGSKAYGALSVRVQYLAACEFIAAVPAKAFYPVPQVDSAIVRLRPRPHQPAATNPRLFATLVKLGFATRRKMLRNNLKSLVERDRLAQILEQLEVNPQVRAEDLSPEQWVILSNHLCHHLSREA